MSDAPQPSDEDVEKLAKEINKFMSWYPCTECRQPAVENGFCASCRCQIAQAAAETIEIMRVGALKKINPNPGPGDPSNASAPNKARESTP